MIAKDCAKSSILWQLLLQLHSTGAFLLWVAAAQGAGDKERVVVDPGIEVMVNAALKPLTQALGTVKGAIRVYLVRSENSMFYMADYKNLIITTAFLLHSDSGELIARLAHELGHIAKGHRKSASKLLFGAGKSINVDSIIAISRGAAISKPSDICAAMDAKLKRSLKPDCVRAVTAHFRLQELEADAAAVALLADAGLPADRLVALVKSESAREYVAEAYRDPIVRLHPPSQARWQAVDRLVTSTRGVQAGAALPPVEPSLIQLVRTIHEGVQ